MQMSAEINEIAGALAAAQAVIKNPDKTKVNPHFKSKYADLATGLDCIRPALSANGIAIVQATEIGRDGMLTLVTRLVHSSGQYFGCTYPVAAGLDHQKLGAALTYAKRQALFTIVGVCGDDDDDGEAASANGGNQLITPEQVGIVQSLIVEVGADIQRFCRYLGVAKIEEIKAKDFDRATSSLEAKRAAE